MFFCWVSTASATVPSNFFGVDLAEAQFKNASDWEALEKEGIGMVRLQFNIHYKLEQGGWENSYDKVVEQAALHNIEILPLLYGRSNNTSAYFLKSKKKESEQSSAEKKEEEEYSEWKGFVASVVWRYGYNGSFWNSHTELREHHYKPLWVWEIWNEPNLNANSPTGQVSAGTYATFLRETSERVTLAQNQIEPTAHNTQILFAGLYQPDLGQSVALFLQKAKESEASITSYFNGLGLHPYGFRVENPQNGEAERLQSLKNNVAEARKALNKMCENCNKKGIWVTEFGWPVTGPENVVTVGEQGRLLTSSYNWLREDAVDNLRYAAWYLYEDLCCYPDEKWAYYDGLRGGFGAYRPSWFAYEAQTGKPKWPADVPSVWPSDNLGGIDGGEISGNPDVASWGNERLDVFARGSNKALYDKYYQGGVGWSGWEQVPNSVNELAGGPGAVSWGEGRIDVVARGPENQVLHWSWDKSDPKWYFDTSLGAPCVDKSCTSSKILGDPDLSSWGPHRLDLFARGADNRLWHRWYDPSAGGWGGWEEIPGGILDSGPSAVSWGEGRIDVVARGPENQVLHWSWDKSDPKWYFDTSLGGQTVSDPAISSRGPRQLDIFGRGTEYRLVHRAYNSGTGWGPWESLGGSLLSGGPGTVSWGPGRIDVVAPAYDNSVYHTAWNEP